MISASVAAAITAVTAIAGAAVSAYGVMQQSAAASTAASTAAKEQKKAAELQAQLALENSKMEAASIQKEAQRTASSQIVSGAGAGISLQSQSLLDLMDETASLYEQDRQQVLRTGKLSAAATTYSAGSLSAKRGGDIWGAAGTLLSGVGTGIKYGSEAGWFS